MALVPLKLALPSETTVALLVMLWMLSSTLALSDGVRNWRLRRLL